MKKLVLLAVLLWCVSVFAQTKVFQSRGVPANPHNKTEYLQPDGSKLIISMNGDAVVNWATTVDGFTLLINNKNGFEYAVKDQEGNLVLSGILAHNPQERTLQELQLLSSLEKDLRFSKEQIEQRVRMHQFFANKADLPKAFPTTGTRKLLVILANFSNTTPTYTQTQFNNFMNQPNYNGTGSFKDYYYENSYGQLTIVSTVTQWVNVPNTHDYYGPESKWGEFAYHAVQAADPYVNYAEFDNDGDGVVDGVAIIHQGRGQEESGSTTDIWSHSWSLSAAGYSSTQRRFDNVYVDAYTTQPEKSGPSSMTTIGVICHEVGHNMGAPDFYDTNYGTGGQYDGTGDWDLMASGSYNGNPAGSKPAHHNAYTKCYVYGWATPTVLSTPQTVSMTNSAQNPVFYRYNTTTTNEYFLLENRQQVGFDSHLPGHGLIIYHVDGSYISSHMNSNDINAGSHQGMFPMAANATTANGVMPSSSSTINTSGCPWPGTSNKTQFTDATTPNSKSWAGANTNKPLTNISENNGVITFCFINCSSNDDPQNFTATAASQTQINLSWQKNSSNNDVMIAYSTSSTFGTPVNGTVYNVGNTIPGGGTVIYKGSATTYSHTGLQPSTKYYYKAWSILTGNNYSQGVTTNATTLCGAVASFPYSESFENAGEIPSCWSQQQVTGTKLWQFVTANGSYPSSAQNGSYFAVFKNTSTTPDVTRLITPQLDFTGKSSATLKFYYYQKNWSGDQDELRVYYKTSASGTWTLVPGGVFTSDVSTWTQVTLSLPNLTNDYYIAFEGTAKYGYGTCIDNIIIEASEQCAGPTTQASNFQASNIQDNSMQITWTRGTGDRVIVVARQGAAVTTDPTDGQSYTANSTFGQGSQIGSGNYVVYDGTGNSVTVTGLQAGTTYYYAIYEYNSSTYCYKKPALTGNATTTGSTPCNYCYSWGHTDYETSITGVTFNTINKISGKTIDANGHAYSDYTNISTTVFKGSTYQLTVKVNTDGNFTVKAKAWIDWNNDCDFNDTGEEYDLGSATNVSNGQTSNSPLNILIPTTATTGSHRMRVSVKYQNYPTNCETNFDGEVEDYTINVLPAGTPLITVNKDNLNFGEVGLGYYRTMNYKVSAVNLTGNLIITSSADFPLSLDQTNFSNTLTLTPTNGTINETTIYVKFQPTTTNNYSTVITHTSAGAQQVNVGASGSGIQWFLPPQNLQATMNENNVTLSWQPPALGSYSTNWYQYGTLEQALYYIGTYYKRITKFDEDDFSLTYPIKITKLRHAFYEPSNDLWGTNNKFRFLILGENLNVVYQSDWLTAINGQYVEHQLTEPVVVTGDFYFGIETQSTTGKPHSSIQQMPHNNYHSYVYNGTNWYILSDGSYAYELVNGLYIENAKGEEIYISTTSNDQCQEMFSADYIDKEKILIAENISPKSFLNGYKIYKNNNVVATLPKNQTTYTDNGICGSYQYKVTAVYTEYNGESEASNTVNVSYESPQITTQPQSQQACVGQTVVFTVEATGTNISYQWKKDGVTIPGATLPTYTINNVNAGHAGTYTCQVSNACGNVTSNVATLTVNVPPAITTQPQSAEVCQGANVSFSVVASGTNLTYQWYKNSVAINGANSSTYTITNVQPGDAGSYTCDVTNACGTVTSNAATLTVNPLPAITTQPQSDEVCQGANVSFSVVASGTNLTYQWYKNSVAINGANSSTYTITNVQPGDAGSYTCDVTNACGTVTTDVASLTVIQDNIIITQQPQDVQINQPQTVTFSVEATGNIVSYQWRKGGVNLVDDGTHIVGSTTNTLTIYNATASDAGTYDVVITGQCQTITSNSANLTFATSISTFDNQIIKIYPNPTEVLINVDFITTTLPNKVYILDINGRILNTLVNVKKSNTIDLTGLSSGLYLLRIEFDNYVTMYKIVLNSK